MRAIFWLWSTKQRVVTITAKVQAPHISVRYLYSRFIQITVFGGSPISRVSARSSVDGDEVNAWASRECSCNPVSLTLQVTRLGARNRRVTI